MQLECLVDSGQNFYSQNNPFIRSFRSEYALTFSDVVGMVCCRCELCRIAADPVVTLIRATLLVLLDVGTGTSTSTCPT